MTWINQKLLSRELRITDFKDLRDGVILCHLLEILTGDTIPFAYSPQTLDQCLDNLNTFLVRVSMLCLLPVVAAEGKISVFWREINVFE